jgi:hypothetical protein
MTTFHTIAIPHDDILQGRLTMDVFAADLWDVYKNRGSEEYRNPALFFQKTYETEGLKTLLDVVESRLKGKGGDPVIQIQTPFGGGKTHALIAMYHRATEWGAKRVVMVGTALSSKDTLWGVLEEQLTGKKQVMTGLVTPGRDAIRALLEPQGSVLILLDEMLEYVTKVAGVAVAESTLASQTIAFLQELTEAICTLEKVSLVVTLTASLLEHFDARAEQLFQQMQRVSGRVEKIYTPVQDHEITQVIRCRLFSHVDTKSANQEISRMIEYAHRETLLPAGMEASEYRERFQASYPFLPEVVDILYQRWGSFATFQRTRGVLRLLALVVYALKDRANPYISLADFDLSNQEIRRELLKHIGAEYDSVIAADITGADAGAKKVSASLGKAYQGLRLGERVATAMFMYSFSGGIEHGVTLSEIKRNATTLENPSSAVAEAVEELKGKLFYIQNQAGKYFFSNQANLNRLLLIRMENIHDPEIKVVEESLLRSSVKGDRLKVSIWREESADIPDTPDLKLVILADLNETKMRSILEEKGSTPRVHRNTLIFLVPLSNERPGFNNLVRKQLSYKGLRDDKTLKLTDDQKEEIKKEIKKLDEDDLLDALRRLYRQLYLPARSGWKTVDLGLPTVGDTKELDHEVYDRLRMEGEILEKIAPLVIKERFLHGRDWVLTSQLYQASLKTPGEARTVSQGIWEAGIAEGVRKGLFGLGELENEQPVYRYFKEEPSISLAEDEILLRAELCEVQRAAQAGQVIFKPGQETPPSGIIQETGQGMKTVPASATGQTAGFPASQTIKGYTQLSFNFVVPKGKVASLMGVLNFLQNRYNRIEMSLNVQEGQLSEQEYEDKIKEAFRQMGIKID